MNIYSYLLFIIIIFYLYAIHEYKFYYKYSKTLRNNQKYKQTKINNRIENKINNKYSGYNIFNTNLSTHSNNMTPATYLY